MSIDSFDQAVDALLEATGGDESTDSAASTPYSPPAESQPNTPVEGDQGTPSELTFLDSKSIDLSQLDETQREYIQAREREMQAAFTRKTQELAAQREEAAQALQFLNELNTNPDFAFEVQTRLGSELQRLGYGQGAEENLDYEVDDPYLAEINELKQWKAQQEQRLAEAEVASRIDRESAVIQSQNPHFTEDDWTSIYGLALSTGGNIQSATDMYKSIGQRELNRYLSQKESANANVPITPAATGHSEQAPESPGDLGSKGLRQAALARLRAEGFD